MAGLPAVIGHESPRRTYAFLSSGVASRAGRLTRWDPSGQAVPIGRPRGWQEVFADNFARDHVSVGRFSGCRAGPTLQSSHCTGLPRGVDRKWWAYADNWHGTPSTGTYFPSRTLSIKHGVLDYYLHAGRVGGRLIHMVDAAIPKLTGPGGSGMRYGRYVVRARWDRLPGYHISFLLWPDSGNWPYDGEIDFPEADLDATSVFGFVHWKGAHCSCQQSSYRVPTDPSRWHTYAIDWLPSSVTFYLDGRLVGRSTGEIPSARLHWVLQVGTSYSEPTPNPATAGHLLVDWAVAYAPR